MANGNFKGGAGTLASPYLIEDALDLNAIRNKPGAYYKLVNNIDLNIDPYNTGTGWTPIPNFSGDLNGNGKIIKNLYINSSVANDIVGFIKNSTGGSIYDLKMTNINITTTGANSIAGGLIGKTDTYSANRYVLRCKLEGKITGTYVAGGVLGLSGITNLEIRDSIVDMTIEAQFASSTIGYAPSYVGDRVYTTFARGFAKAQNNLNYFTSSNVFTADCAILGDATTPTNYLYSGTLTVIKDTEQGYLYKYPNFSDIISPIKTPTFIIINNKLSLYYETAQKLLFCIDGTYKGFSNGNWIDLGTSYPSSDAFLQYGIYDSKDIGNKIYELNVSKDIGVLAYLNTDDTTATKNIIYTKGVSSLVDKIDATIYTETTSNFVPSGLEYSIVFETNQDSLVTASNAISYTTESKVDSIPDTNLNINYDINHDNIISTDIQYEIESPISNDNIANNTLVYFERNIETTDTIINVEYDKNARTGNKAILNIETNATSKVRYLISRDNKVSWEAYKNNIWVKVDPKNINDEGMTLTELNQIQSIIWKDFTPDNAYKYTFLIMFSAVNSDGTINYPAVRKIDVEYAPNEAPIIKNISVSPQDHIHTEWVELKATVEDKENDKWAFQVWIKKAGTTDPYQEYPATAGEWSPYRESGTDILKSYNFKYFNPGENTIIFKVKDERGATNEISGNITLTNSPPIPVITRAMNYITCKITDAEFDKVCYRLTIKNSKTNFKEDIQIYPRQDDIDNIVIDNGNRYKGWLATPHEIKYTLNTDDIVIGEENILTIQCFDELGAKYSAEIKFIGEHMGLMFVDNKGKYYTTGNGKVLQKLDLGTIVASNTTKIYNFNVENKLPTDVQNINVSVADMKGLDIQLSNTDNPFIPLDLVQITRLNTLEKYPVFLRVATTKNTVFSGDFDVSITAEDI